MSRSHVVLVVVLLLALASQVWSQESSPAPPTAAPSAPSDEQRPTAEGEAPAVGEVIALSGLAKGDHVSLLMVNGQSFEGHVAGVEAADIILDFTFSRQRVAGTITFPQSGVSVAMKLPELTKEEKALRLEARRQRALKARERWSMVAGTDLKGKPQALELTADQQERRRRSEEEREVEEYQTLLRESPPEQGWGPERLAQIRHRHFIYGMPLTYPEWRFWQVFDQWSEAVTIVELHEQRRKQEREMLLTMFPPAEGWGPAVRQQLQEKQESDEELTELEARFLQDYDRWQEAATAAEEEQPPPGEAVPGASAPPPATTGSPTS